MQPPYDALQQDIAAYVNTADCNDRLLAEFAHRTNSIPFLKAHRDKVERNQWGTGERAFHFMWYSLVGDSANRARRPIELLEIGVFKGQIISLWLLIARELGIDVKVTAISPLEGNVATTSSLTHRLRRRIDPWYRKRAQVGNLYARDDYLAVIQRVFREFTLNLEEVRLIKGYSNDARVAEQVAGQQFDVVYIDGDHSYEIAKQDIHNYAPLVRPGGYVVMDDASFLLPGSFWKGYETVARACEELPRLGFRNVLNVGHNRLFCKD